MRINSAELILRTSNPKEYPRDTYPQLILAGRSNVGKSSLINTICGRKKLAGISKQPGKTRTISFYLVNNSFYLVDLPGYGYAKVSKKRREQWREMVDMYVEGADKIIGSILVLDIRHEPSPLDGVVVDWLTARELPVIPVATKADKVSRGRWRSRMEILSRGLGLDIARDIIPFSAKDKTGVGELIARIEDVLNKQGGVT